MSQDKLNIGYVLYVHYNQDSKEDYDDYRKKCEGKDHVGYVITTDKSIRNNGILPNIADSDGINLNLKGVERIKKFMPQLARLLKNAAHPQSGRLTIFYDYGLRKLLEKIRPALGGSKEEKEEIRKSLLEKEEELRFGWVVGTLLRKSVEDEDLAYNIRIMTAIDLVNIFAEMADVHELRHLFMGEQGQLGYDGPKIVDAIVRLRLIGSGTPVFRLDQDVLFPDEEIEESFTKLKAAIDEQIKKLKEHGEQSSIHRTILSSSYESVKNYKIRKRKKDEKSICDCTAFARAEAMRVQPILKVNNKSIIEIHGNQNSEERKKLWNDYAVNNFDPAIAEKFFNNENLRHWGAPTTAVISGALLYMSGGVVLDLPPFSNLSLNVMWIDDHLRYALHRELGHFADTTLTDSSGKYLNVKSDIEVIKCRTGYDDLVAYTLCSYLPSLLYGAIFDAWISDPEKTLLKLRRINLREDEQSQWDEMKKAGKKGGNNGVLAKRIKQALAGKALTDEIKFREELRAVALKRIETVRNIWGKEDMTGTFAYHWINGTVPGGIILLLPKEKKEIAQGLPPVSSPELPQIIIGSVLGNLLERLITDTVNYLRWIQKWPHIVQIVRSVNRGELPSDLD